MLFDLAPRKGNNRGIEHVGQPLPDFRVDRRWAQRNAEQRGVASGLLPARGQRRLGVFPSQPVTGNQGLHNGLGGVLVGHLGPALLGNGACKRLARKRQRPQHAVAHRQTPGLPGCQMLTQAMNRAACKFNREMIRGVALHQRGGRQHQFSVPVDGPRNVKLARIAFRPFDQELPLLPLAAALPRQVVHAGEIGSFERVGSQNWTRHEKSHQAHRLGIRCSNRVVGRSTKSFRFGTNREPPGAGREPRSACDARLGLDCRTRCLHAPVHCDVGTRAVPSALDACGAPHRRRPMWFIVRRNAIGD